MPRPPHTTTRKLPALLIALALASSPGSAHAQPASPRADGLDVGGVEVVGLPAELGAFPRDGLELTPRSKILGTKRTALTKRRLDADRDRIRLWLVRRGYPDAVVTASATADDKGKRATVEFSVTPGTRVRYGAVAVTGLPAALEGKAGERVAALAVPGGPFDQGALETLRAELLELVREAGHARPAAKVEVRRGGDIAAVTFVLTPGPSYVFRQVTVNGLEPDLTRLATRVIGLSPGDPATATRLNDVRKDLRKLNLFRQIDIALTPVEPDSLDLAAAFTLQAMTTWELSVGTFTDDPIRGSAAWTHRNLFGHGRSLHVEAEVSAHDAEALIRTSWPARPLRRSRTDLSLSYTVASEDNYVQRTAEAELATVFDLSDKNTARLGLALSVDEVDDDPSSAEFFGDNAGLTPMLKARIHRDATDHPIEPAGGHRATVTAEWSPPIKLSENPFVWVRGYGSWYRSLHKGTVLAARLDLGVARSLREGNDLLPTSRFFAGGATSMRGYERQRLGPVDSANLPVGGEAIILAGVELRQRLFEVFGVKLGMTLFLDSGQVWESRLDVTSGDLKAAMGGGLLVGTPIGPLRFEAANHIGDPMHGDPDTVYHFAIGHPY
jgi:outer membrane protein assembly factor BamA